MAKHLQPAADRPASEAAIHHSYWAQQHALERQYPPLQNDHETEILVVGAGITGLSVALELLARGHRVTVCESNTIGAGTTGGSSGHLDAHPEKGPRWLVQQLGDEAARAYTQIRLDAIDIIADRCRDQCAFARVPAYAYTENRDAIDDRRADFEAAKQIGLEATWTDSIPIANAVGGYRIENMARMDCLAYLRQLADLVHDRGGEIFEQTLVSGPMEKEPTSLPTSGGKVHFDHVVCAVHCNFTNAQRLYLQTPPYQSYVVAARTGPELPDALFWDDSDPYYYVRRATGDGHTILAGGRDHRTGSDDETHALDELEAWVRGRFAVQEITARWSAELFEPTDGLPFIGQVPGKKNVWIATGLSGIGLTLGTAAGVMIANGVEGQPHPLQDQLSPSRISVGSVATVVAEQLPAVGDMAERILPANRFEPDALGLGEGMVGMVDGAHTAACRDAQGCIHRHSPICTHMGGVLRWNPVEQTWDCPVHGGRFAADGKRLYGPPENDLESPES